MWPGRQCIPNIGEVVIHTMSEPSMPGGEFFIHDWVCQVRLGEEQAVLVWGMNKEKFYPGDRWEPT